MVSALSYHFWHMLEIISFLFPRSDLYSLDTPFESLQRIEFSRQFAGLMTLNEGFSLTSRKNFRDKVKPPYSRKLEMISYLF